jgi:DNA-binding transcriptional ArsR family regulator
VSVQALYWARQQHVGDRAAKAVLRSLADQANADGICWPGVESIATDCEMDRSTVQRKLRLLEKVGLIRCIPRQGRSNVYELRLGIAIEVRKLYVVPTEGAASRGTGGPQRAALGPQDAGTGGRSVQPESKEKHHGSSTPRRTPAARKPDKVWDALVFSFGEPTNDDERGRRNKSVKLIRQSLETAGLSEDDAAGAIALAVNAWSRRYPGAALTDKALASHWSELAPRGGLPKPPCEECGVGGGEHLADCQFVARAAAREAELTDEVARGRAVCDECSIGGGKHTADCTRAAAA